MSNYEVPKWAGKAPSGLHLDVLKDDKFIQKILIDEKKCYFFGRSELNDFRIDHASCSRTHACLLYHKHLNLNYLVDLNSTHGTFIGGGNGAHSLRLEPHKPTPIQVGSTFHFGASTRNYILRERVKVAHIVEDIAGSDTVLPENEDEIDQITEYNTAHNRKISTLGITDVIVKKGVKRKQVHFNDDEIIINPEDIDPNIGRFRNLVQSTVIPMSNKKARLDSSGNFGIGGSHSSSSFEHKHHPIMSVTSTSTSLYSGLDDPYQERHDEKSNYPFVFPNPAPEIESTSSINKISSSSSLSATTTQLQYSEDYGDYEQEPKKKKYKKETWHGAKKPVKAFGDI